ncbi:MAG TPA: hypothetical protein VFR02_10215 [bacterium]|nr:hypothetical protein [bacterium]
MSPRVRFHLETPAPQPSLRVYTVAFREVLMIPLAPLAPGDHDIPLGKLSLANGLYYLEVPGETRPVKWLVLR